MSYEDEILQFRQLNGLHVHQADRLSVCCLRACYCKYFKYTKICSCKHLQLHCKCFKHFAFSNEHLGRGVTIMRAGNMLLSPNCAPNIEYQSINFTKGDYKVS